jgi:nucleoside-diphosphate-sugar epimerase
MTRRCVVIGGSGFLGSAIVDELKLRGDDVLSVDRDHDYTSQEWCDITNADSVSGVVRGAEEVYLIAGVLGTSELDMGIYNAANVNILGAINVLDACVNAKVPKLFYPSKPNPWLNTYTITKIAAEQFVRLYRERFGLQTVVMRFFNVYGPRQHFYPIRKIMPTFCLQARVHKPLTILGTGKNISDQIFSRDVARIVVDAMRMGLTDQVYELGRGIGMTPIEIAADVNKLAGLPADHIRFFPMRRGEEEDTVLVANVEPLAKAFAKKGSGLWFSDWAETLEETFDYYMSLSMDDVRKAMEIWQ